MSNLSHITAQLADLTRSVQAKTRELHSAAYEAEKVVVTIAFRDGDEVEFETWARYGAHEFALYIARQIVESGNRRHAMGVEVRCCDHKVSYCEAIPPYEWCFR